MSRSRPHGTALSATRRGAPLALLLALAAAMPAAAAPPRIITAAPAGPAFAWQPVQVVVTARGTALDGLRVTYPDLRGGITQAACIRGSARRGTTRFSFTYRPEWVGTHVIGVTVLDGACRGGARRASRPVSIEVAQPPGPVTWAEPCPGAGLFPGGRAIRPARRALLCLLNEARREAGLPALRTRAKLNRIAVRRAKGTRRRTGAHISFGVGPGATAREVAAAWLGSEPHRRHLMSRRTRSVGIGTHATISAPMRHPAAFWVLQPAR